MSGFLQDVWPYLLLFFLVEALVRVRPHQRLLVSGGARGPLSLGPGVQITGLDPFEEAVLAEELPLIPGADALHRPPAGLAPAESERCAPEELRAVPWGELGPVTARGTKLSAAAGALAQTGSLGASRQLRDLLAELRDAPAGERSALLQRRLRARFDVAELRRLREATRWSRITTHLAAGALAGTFFLLLPFSLYSPGGSRLHWLPWLLGAAAACWLAALGGAAATLRRAGAGGIFEVLMPMAFYPPAAVHAPRVVAAELHAPFEPLAVARALLDDARFGRLAREAWHRERGALAASGAERAAYWEQRLEGWEGLFAGPADREAALAGPAAEDASAASYCPLCSSQHRAGFARCAGCGVELIALGG